MLVKFLPFVPILIILALLAVRYCEAAVIAMLGWALIEGAVRKWVFPEYQEPLLLLKDFVLIFAYASLVMRKNTGAFQQNYSKLFIVLIISEFIFCLFQLLNPNSPSPLLGIYGIKNYIIYIPLILAMPKILDRREKLEKFLLGICIFSIPIALLGLYQFSQPPSNWINQYLSHEEGVDLNVATFGESAGSGDFIYGRARASSTFSYIGGFVTYLMIAVPVAAALLLASFLNRQKTIIALAALVLLIAGAATTGSRSPFLIFAFGTLLMLPMIAAKRILSVKITIRIMAGLFAVGGLALTFSGSAFSALEYRASNTDSAMERMLYPVTETYDAFATSPVIGTGIGTNSNAAISIMGETMPWWLGGYSYEGEPARVMQELGLLGFILVYLPKLVAIFLIIGFYRQSHSPLMIATHLAALVFVSVNFVFATVNNPTGGLIYWAAIGVAMAAHRIEIGERAAEYERFHHASQAYRHGDAMLT